MPRPTRTTPSVTARAVSVVLPVAAVLTMAGACVVAGEAAMGGAPSTAPPPTLHVTPAAVESAPQVVLDTDPSVVFAQDGSTVTVTRDGHPVATVTATALARQGSGARLDLTVTATEPFSLSDDAVVLEDTAGAEDPLPARGVHAFAIGTSTAVMVWPHASPRARAGAVLWGPGTQTAGVWVLGEVPSSDG